MCIICVQPPSSVYGLLLSRRMQNLAPPLAPSISLRYGAFWGLLGNGRVSPSAIVKFVAVCVRVCWSCYRSGGTDVVDLPDILLPAGQYLDMFDSESDLSGDLSDSDSEELHEIF